MARLRHPERGTEVEVDDDAAESMTADGWTVAGSDDAHDDEPKRRKSTRKES